MAGAAAVALLSLSDSQTDCQWMIRAPPLSDAVASAQRDGAFAALGEPGDAPEPVGCEAAEEARLSDIGVPLVGGSTP